MRTRKNIRLIGYDYSQDGVYFVTICSRERENIFARIGVGAPLACARTHNTNNLPNMNHEISIDLTEIGKIIKTQWIAISNQFDAVLLDEFIVMPNHIHGIVILKKRAQVPTGHKQAAPLPSAMLYGHSNQNVPMNI
jgi:REP element-mobilizing transposase RayT